MSSLPKELAHKHFPEMGSQYEVGLANVGLHTLEATLSVNTSITDAQIVASAPNVAVNQSNVFVHSLGAVPSAVIAMPLEEANLPIQPQYVTADNSAFYMRGVTWTGGVTAHAFRFQIIR